MPTVTQLSPQVKNPNRYNLYLDGEFVCGVDPETIARYTLAKNLEVSRELVESIIRDSDIGKIYQRVLDYLARRPRSEQEVRRYIKDKMYTHKLKELLDDPEEVESVTNRIVARLHEYGYVDDTEFVRWWIGQRTDTRKPSALIRITSELRGKGVDDVTIKSLWGELEMDDATLLERHLSTISDKYDITNPSDKKRMVAYLQRKGFRWDTIRSMLK